MKNIKNYLKLWLISLFCILGSTSQAQKNELGGGLGALNYIGEASRFYNPVNLRPAAYVFYRRNLSPVVATRFSLTVGNVQATERSNTAIGNARGATFNGLLTDVAVTFEYNFFDYILNYLDRKYARKYSPYLTAGVCLYNFNSTSSESKVKDLNTNIGIPVGIGIKYMFTEKWNIGAELVARKTFSDKFDGIDSSTINGKMAYDSEDKDFYYFLGFNISYTFFKVHCPGK